MFTVWHVWQTKVKHDRNSKIVGEAEPMQVTASGVGVVTLTVPAFEQGEQYLLRMTIEEAKGLSDALHSVIERVKLIDRWQFVSSDAVAVERIPLKGEEGGI